MEREKRKKRINLPDPNYAESPFPVKVFEHTNHKKQKAATLPTLYPATEIR
ncbi:MAG: hypothetical protein ABSC20_06820 [Candidatus Bathyarchaeia archaeon]|jgi:hypothetical protein